MSGQRGRRARARSSSWLQPDTYGRDADADARRAQAWQEHPTRQAVAFRGAWRASRDRGSRSFPSLRHSVRACLPAAGLGDVRAGIGGSVGWRGRGSGRGNVGNVVHTRASPRRREQHCKISDVRVGPARASEDERRRASRAERIGGFIKVCLSYAVHRHDLSTMHHHPRIVGLCSSARAAPATPRRMRLWRNPTRTDVLSRAHARTCPLPSVRTRQLQSSVLLESCFGSRPTQQQSPPTERIFPCAPPRAHRRPPRRAAPPAHTQSFHA